jgi:hypothetical protein
MSRARCLPLFAPWGKKMLEEHKSIENRGTDPKSVNTALASADYCVYLGETKAVDPRYPGAENERVAPDMPSALVAAVRVAAVLDYSCAEHLAALADCASTARWVSAQGKKCGLVISHIVRLPTPLPYRGVQGIHYLPADIPPAATLFDSLDVQELLTPAEVAPFAALHAGYDWSRKRKRHINITASNY